MEWLVLFIAGLIIGSIAGYKFKEFKNDDG